MRSLLLIPTAFEKSKCPLEFLEHLDSFGVDVEVCGFGVIAAAALSSRLIALKKPTRVILLGIAGLYETDHAIGLQVGQSVQFDSVACYGIGVGNGAAYKSASELGWSQLPTSVSSTTAGEEYLLNTVRDGNAIPTDRLLLSVAAASSNYEESIEKLKRFPNAIAEDMEGYGVAMACELSSTPLTIVRGISNRVGDRDHKRWMVDEAMANGCKLVLEILRGSE